MYISNSGKTYVADNKLVEKIARNLQVDMQYRDDFIQDMYLILCEQDDELINNMVDRKQINYWLTRVSLNNWKSDTSNFYKRYKEYNNRKTTMYND